MIMKQRISAIALKLGPMEEKRSGKEYQEASETVIEKFVRAMMG